MQGIFGKLGLLEIPFNEQELVTLTMMDMYFLIVDRLI